MEGQQAVILMEHELQHILESTAKMAAKEVIEAFRAEMAGNPHDVITHKLRAYILDRSTLHNPREHWANGYHIRSIKMGAHSKVRSTSWFHKFKMDSGLSACFSRKSLAGGGAREWCFEDIANAWERAQF